MWRTGPLNFKRLTVGQDRSHAQLHGMEQSGVKEASMARPHIFERRPEQAFTEAMARIGLPNNHRRLGDLKGVPLFSCVGLSTQSRAANDQKKGPEGPLEKEGVIP